MTSIGLALRAPRCHLPPRICDAQSSDPQAQPAGTHLCRSARNLRCRALPPFHAQSTSIPPRARSPRKLPWPRLRQRRQQPHHAAVRLQQHLTKPAGPPRLPSIWYGEFSFSPHTSNRLCRVRLAKQLQHVLVGSLAIFQSRHAVDDPRRDQPVLPPPAARRLSSVTRAAFASSGVPQRDLVLRIQPEEMRDVPVPGLVVVVILLPLLQPPIVRDR